MNTYFLEDAGLLAAVTALMLLALWAWAGNGGRR